MSNAVITAFAQTLTDKTGASYTARALVKGDRERLLDMYASFEPKRAAQGLPPNSEAKIGLWLNFVLHRGRHLVVEVNGKLVGHVMLIPKEDGSLELANFIHQSVRNRGIGTQMNALALKLAHDAGYTRIWLSVEPGNRAAVRSYEKVGFVPLPGSHWAREIEMAVELNGVQSVSA